MVYRRAFNSVRKLRKNAALRRVVAAVLAEVEVAQHMAEHFHGSATLANDLTLIAEELVTQPQAAAARASDMQDRAFADWNTLDDNRLGLNLAQQRQKDSLERECILMRRIEAHAQRFARRAALAS